MYNNWCNNDNVTKYLPWHAHKSVEDTKAYMDFLQSEYKSKPTYRWGIVYLENHELIGCIDVVKFIDNCPEVGYCIGEKYWSKGIPVIYSTISFRRKKFKSLYTYFFCPNLQVAIL